MSCVVKCQMLYLQRKEGSGMSVLYYLGMTACHFFNTFTSVRYGRETKGFFSLAVSSCVTCIIASLFFFTLTGFQPKFNAVTAVYAIVFALICLISQYTGFSISRYTDVVSRGMIFGGVSLILNSLMGVFIFQENFTLITAARIACMLAAGVAAYFHNRHLSTGKWTRLGWILSILMVINGVGSNAIHKLYATDTRVVDDSSYFLLVNLFCLTASLVLAIGCKRGDLRCCTQELLDIRPRQYLYIALNTISGNVSSLLIMAILAGGDIVLFAPLNSALALLTTQLIAVMIEKEKFMPIPVVFALASAVLSFWG